MKKKLLLGTALTTGAMLIWAGQALASDPPSLKVSGYARFEAWFGDQDDEGDVGPRTVHFDTNDVDIRFRAEATSDSGLKYGADILLDMDGNAVTDEAHLYFSGEWGRLEVGDEDGAEDAMPYDGTFSLMGSQFGYDGGTAGYFDFNGVTAGSPDMAGATFDATKVTYYTPRFSGFQVGASYTPDSGHALSGALSSTSATYFEHHFGLGANFVESFNGVDVSIGGAWVTSELESGAASGDNGAEGYHVGFNVGYMGFTAGFGYGNNQDTGLTAAEVASGKDAGQWWEAAASYSTGPWATSIGYFHGQASNATGTPDDETDFFTVAINYDVAPGLSVYAEFDHIKIDNGEGSGSTFDNEGNIFMVGTNINF